MPPRLALGFDALAPVCEAPPSKRSWISIAVAKASGPRAGGATSVILPCALGQGPPIIQYWDTDAIPGDVATLLDSFRRHNPDFEHRVYSESSAERFIAEHFGPRELRAFQACAVPAMQADYFRYCAMLIMGGVYADADYHCTRSLQPLLDRCNGGVLFLRPDEHVLMGREAKRVLNGFLAFRRPGHPFLQLTLEVATANIEARIAERTWREGERVPAAIWLTVGPGIFTSLRLISNWGSFETFVEATAGTHAEPFAGLYCEVIGDYGRLQDAIQGIEFGSFAEMLTWVDHPCVPPAYKETERHWQNVTTRIFR